MDYTEALKKVREDLKTMMTEDGISDEHLEKLTELNKSVDELDKSHQELADKHSKMKDKYIDAITNFGTSEKPKEDNGTPRSLEEIASDVLSKTEK